MQLITYENIEKCVKVIRTGYDHICYTSILHKTSFRILSLTNNFYNKQFHQNQSIPRQWNKHRKYACKFKSRIKKTTRTSKNNPPVIIAKDKNANNSTFIEEVSELFKEIPSNIKQEIRAISSYSFKDKLKKYV